MGQTILVLTALIALSGSPNPAATGCTCEESKSKNGWCGGCKVGYVAGVRIESRELFEAIDAHGHHVDPNSYRCETCQKALETDGYCSECKTGFVDKEAYFSKLTYYLAKGSPRSPARIACLTCRKNAEHPGWCESCKLGMVGRIEFKNRGDYEGAARARKVLVRAIRKAASCETCAIAMAVDRKCYRCMVSYEDGERE